MCLLVIFVIIFALVLPLLLCLIIWIWIKLFVSIRSFCSFEDGDDDFVIFVKKEFDDQKTFKVYLNDQSRTRDVKNTIKNMENIPSKHQRLKLKKYKHKKNINKKPKLNINIKKKLGWSTTRWIYQMTRCSITWTMETLFVWIYT